MKSYSREIPSTTDVVSVEDFTKFVAKLETVGRRTRNWIFGLFVFNLVITVVCFYIVTHH